MLFHWKQIEAKAASYVNDEVRMPILFAFVQKRQANSTFSSFKGCPADVKWLVLDDKLGPPLPM